MARKRHAARRTGIRNSLLVVALLVSILGLGYPLFLATPSHIVASAGRMLAAGAISMTVAVPINPYNTLAEQLKAKELELDQREAAIGVHPGQTNTTPVSATLGDTLGVYSFFVSIILLVLVAINFYYDVERRNKRAPTTPTAKYSVDLR